MLSAASAVTGVGHLDELVGLLARLIVSCDSAEDLEGALDGVSRLCAHDPTELGAATGTLRARAAALLGAGGGMAFVSSEPRMDVCGVVAAWLDGDAPSDGVPVTRTVGAFLSRRAHEVAQRAARRHARVLLAAPTHRGGWIEASLLATRLEGLHAHGDRPDLGDAVQAILRVHPAGCEQALPRLGRLHDEVSQAVCYALGAPVEMAGPTAALWVAAAAVRGTAGSDPLVGRQHPGRCPDTAFFSELGVAAGNGVIADSVGATDLADGAGLAGGDGLAVAWVDQVRPSLHPRVARWAATLWPGHLDWLFVKGCEALHYWRDATVPGLADVLEPALDPDVDLGTSGVRLLVLALAAKDRSCRCMGAGALTAAIVDGRVDGARLGHALGGLLACGAVTATRISRPLSGVAQTSPLHAEVIRLGVEGALDGDPTDARADLHALLALLVDLATDAGTGVTAPAARAYLAGVQGKTKRARFARDLLALPARPSRHASAAAAIALDGRLARAQRWTTNAATHPCPTSL